MPSGSEILKRHRRCRAVLKTRGQEHVLRWWDELDAIQRERLLSDLESIPWDELDPYLTNEAPNISDDLTEAEVTPADVFPQQPSSEQRSLYKKAKRRGRELIGAGAVAAFTVAGGQGTRLGHDGPKGCLGITPVGSRTLFELFADMICAVRDRYQVAVPWYIMTSPANHQQTLDYFATHRHFSLVQDDIVFFQQRMLPQFDRHGLLLLADKNRLALGPDGHGGSLGALHRSGALEDMKARGVQVVSYFQVDNPLVKPFDPLFLGLHDLLGSEMSLKATSKAHAQERVGNICTIDGKVGVVEYNEFPRAWAGLVYEDGTRRFDAANLAIHLIDLAFLERVVLRPGSMPFRRALKTVPFLNETAAQVQPKEPNALKFELFIFDILPLAKKTLVFQVDRAEEFSPVKNASGADSPATAMRDQVRRACRWLETAGVEVPRKPDGEPDVTVAISPRIALEAEDLLTQPAERLRLHRGETRYID